MNALILLLLYVSFFILTVQTVKLSELIILKNYKLDRYAEMIIKEHFKLKIKSIE